MIILFSVDFGQPRYEESQGGNWHFLRKRFYIVTVTIFKEYLIVIVTIFKKYLIVTLEKYSLVQPHVEGNPNS